MELEPKFILLGQQNIDLWLRKFRHWPHLGAARVVQGDSRKLKWIMAKFIGEPGLIISSSPYPSGGHHPDQIGAWGGLASHKGFADKENTGYSNTLGQLGKMKEGKFDSVISSPPFAYQEPSHARGNPPSTERLTSCKGRSFIESTMGDSPGQLGSMREGEFDAVVSSPPYENKHIDPGNVGNKLMRNRWGKGRLDAIGKDKYGNSTGQLGNTSGDTFWSARPGSRCPSPNAGPLSANR